VDRAARENGLVSAKQRPASKKPSDDYDEHVDQNSQQDDFAEWKWLALILLFAHRPTSFVSTRFRLRASAWGFVVSRRSGAGP
jgi:hypothetical protein